MSGGQAEASATFYVDPAETSKQSLDKSVKALGKQMDNLYRQQIYLRWVSKVVKQI